MWLEIIEIKSEMNLSMKKSNKLCEKKLIVVKTFDSFTTISKILIDNFYLYKRYYERKQKNIRCVDVF